MVDGPGSHLPGWIQFIGHPLPAVTEPADEPVCPVVLVPHPLLLEVAADTRRVGCHPGRPLRAAQEATRIPGLQRLPAPGCACRFFDADQPLSPVIGQAGGHVVDITVGQQKAGRAPCVEARGLTDAVAHLGQVACACVGGGGAVVAPGGHVGHVGARSVVAEWLPLRRVSPPIFPGWHGGVQGCGEAAAAVGVGGGTPDLPAQRSGLHIVGNVAAVQPGHATRSGSCGERVWPVVVDPGLDLPRRGHHLRDGPDGMPARADLACARWQRRTRGEQGCAVGRPVEPFHAHDFQFAGRVIRMAGACSGEVVLDGWIAAVVENHRALAGIASGAGGLAAPFKLQAAMAQGGSQPDSRTVRQGDFRAHSRLPAVASPYDAALDGVGHYHLGWLGEPQDMPIGAVCLRGRGHQPSGGVPGPATVGDAGLVDACAQCPGQRGVVGEPLHGAVWPAHRAQSLRGVVLEDRWMAFVIDDIGDQVGGLAQGIGDVAHTQLAAKGIADGQQPIRPGRDSGRGGGVTVGQPLPARAVGIHHVHQHACGREVVRALVARVAVQPAGATAAHEQQAVGLVRWWQHQVAGGSATEAQPAAARHAVEPGMSSPRRDAGVQSVRPQRAESHRTRTVWNAQSDWPGGTRQARNIVGLECADAELPGESAAAVVQGQGWRLAGPAPQRHLLVLFAGQAVDRVTELAARVCTVGRALDILLDDHRVVVGRHVAAQGGRAVSVLVEAAGAGDLPSAGHVRRPRLAGSVMACRALQHRTAGRRSFLPAAEVTLVGHTAFGVRHPAGGRTIGRAIRDGIRS